MHSLDPEIDRLSVKLREIAWSTGPASSIVNNMFHRRASSELRVIFLNTTRLKPIAFGGIPNS